MAQQTKKRGKLRSIFYWLLAAILLPVIILWSFSFYVNSIELPDELRRPPRLAQLLTKTALSPRQRKASRETTGALYLELVELWEQGDVQKQYSERFLGQQPNRQGKTPVSDEQAEWLRKQGALLALFQRTITAGDLPVRDSNELLSPELDIQDFIDNELANYGMLLSLAGMLARDGRRRAQEGDAAGAVADFLAIERLGHNLSADFALISYLINGITRRDCYPSLREMLEKGTVPAEVLRTMQEGLQVPRDKASSVERQINGRDWEYLAGRQMLVRELDGPWPQLLRTIGGYNPYQQLQHDPGRVLTDAWAAIRLKRNGAEFLRTWDAWQQAATESMRRPHTLEEPEELQALEQRLEEYVEEYHYGQAPSARAYKIGMLREQAERNLLRAGAAWLSDGDAALENLPADFADAPDHPWRDPFTERPLQVRRTATHVLIYSLGPDQVDQRGEIEEPEYNYGVAPGDIIIRLPLPPPAENPAP